MTTKEWTEEPSLYAWAGAQNAIPVPPAPRTLRAEAPNLRPKAPPITRAQWKSQDWQESQGCKLLINRP